MRHRTRPAPLLAPVYLSKKNWKNVVWQKQSGTKLKRYISTQPRKKARGGEKLSWTGNLPKKNLQPRNTTGSSEKLSWTGIIAGVFFSSAFFLLAYSTVGSPDLRVPFYASAPALVAALLLAIREIFFRGILQRRLGLVPTALLFAIALPPLYAGSYAAYALFFAYLFFEGLLLGVIRQRYGLPSCVLFVELHLLFFVLSQASRYAVSAVLPLLLLAFPFVLLARSDAQLRSALQSLGLKQVRRSDAGTGVLGTLMLMAVTFMEVSVASSLGSTDVENVRRIVGNAPLPVRMLSFTLTPLAEETFFRGFLQPRFGILLQSAAFAFFHFGYGSITEVAGALSAGIVLGLLYKKTGSLAAPIIAHGLYNFFAIAVMASA